LESLQELVGILGAERQVVIARELTKLHEEFIRGAAREILKSLEGRELRGEITLLIGKAEQLQPAIAAPDIILRLEQVMQEQGIDEKSALKILAKERGLSKSEVYREVQRAQNSRAAKKN
jgi:16S rRNA (cytidine1402-2'-O)-methyltransferase